MWGNMFQKKEPTEDLIRESMRQVPLFQQLSPKELRKIEDHVYVRTYREGEHIYQRGEPGLGMYVVHQGSVAIRRALDTSREDADPVVILEKGNSFGEMALLEEHVHLVSAKANTDTKVIGFYRPDFLTLIHYHPRLGNKLLLGLGRIVGARFREFMKNAEQAKA